MQDRDNDGVIYPWDTFVGFRRLGFNLLLSALAVPIVHGTFSLQSQNSWLIDPRLPIYIRNVHLCKHGSDSEVRAEATLHRIEQVSSHITCAPTSCTYRP